MVVPPVAAPLVGEAVMSSDFLDTVPVFIMLNSFVFVACVALTPEFWIFGSLFSVGDILVPPRSVSARRFLLVLVSECNGFVRFGDKAANVYCVVLKYFVVGC